MRPLQWLGLVVFAGGLALAPQAFAGEPARSEDAGAKLDRLGDRVSAAMGERAWQPDVSPEGELTWLKKIDRYAGELDKLDGSRLSQQGQITRDLLRRYLHEQHDFVAKGFDGGDLRAADNESLLSTYFNGVDGGQATAADWEGQIEWLKGAPDFMEKYIGLLERGLTSGRGRAPEVVKNAIAWLDSVSSEDASNPFFRMERDLEESLKGKPELGALKRRLDRVLRTRVLPAHARLKTFLAERYLPRTTVRLGQSRDEYLFHMERNIGPGHTPEELATFGRQEVARLNGELEKAVRQIDPTTTSLASSMRQLQAQKDQRYRTAEELMAHAEEETSKAARVARGMAPIPRHSLTIAPVGKADEATVEAAYMGDDANPGHGTFYVNTGPRLKAQRRFDMATLATHETMGGHALADVYAGKLTGKVSDVRDSLGSTAFDEGWALYSEQWRDDHGQFTPTERIGYLTNQLWRAARLVVDTGIHTGTMTPEEATDYFSKVVFLPRARAAAEIERYINWPGQALAYAVGRREILRTRDAVKAAMGPAYFDERAFHAKLLSLGSVDPVVSRDHMLHWANQAKAQLERSSPPPSPLPHAATPTLPHVMMTTLPRAAPAQAR